MAVPKMKAMRGQEFDAWAARDELLALQLSRDAALGPEQAERQAKQVRRAGETV